MHLTEIVNRISRWGPIGKMPTKTKVVTSIILVIALFAGVSIYIWGQMFASEVPADGTVTNQATVTYTDSQGHQRTVASNIVTSEVTSVTPTPMEYTFSKAGWYLISIPGTLTSTDPRTIFRHGQQGGIDIDDSLIRFYTPTQQLQTWSATNPMAFAPMATGEGYWIEISPSEAGRKISNSGSELTTAQTVSLVNQKNDSWAIIGNPFNHTINTKNKLTFYQSSNPSVRKTYLQAYDAGWIDSVMYVWEGSVQGLQAICPLEHWCESEDLQAWHGAWLKLKNKDLVVEIAP